MASLSCSQSVQLSIIGLIMIGVDDDAIPPRFVPLACVGVGARAACT